VACDAGPLIHLDELGCLDLLGDFSRVIVPESVWREVEIHRPHALAHPGVSFERRGVSAEKDPEIETLALLLLLQQGETDALRIMREGRGNFLLTDDTAARIAARSLGMPVHGTIGMLVRAIRRKMKTPFETVALLRSIPEKSTLHVRHTLLEEIIHQIERMF